MLAQRRGQITIEFMVVYAIILIVFVILFSIITTQRAATLVTQQYSLMQLQAEDIAYYINHAISAGSGYSATISLVSGASSKPYNITMSNMGVVVLTSNTAGRYISAYAFSSARNMVINGALQSSSNGISTYSVASYTGTMTIANEGGIIYIDQSPYSTLGLFGDQIDDIHESYAAGFDGADSFVSVPDAQQLRLDGAQPSYTIELWARRAAISSGGLLGKHTASGGYAIGIGNGGCSGSEINFSRVGVVNTLCVGQLPSDTNWHQLVLVFNSIGTFSYVDGALSGSSSESAAVASATAPLTLGNSSGSLYFNGQLGNVQIYNSSLTPSQIGSLYRSGLLGLPVESGNLVGYWPLRGDANDYSGNSYDGQYHDVAWQNLAELGIRLQTRAGAPLANGIVGIVDNGSATVGPNAVAASLTASSGGILNAYVSYGSAGTAVSIFPFTGNMSTANSLVGWWPFTYGDSNGGSIEDISGNGDDALVTNALWQRRSSQGSFTALEATVPSNLESGYVRVIPAGGLLNLPQSANFTLVAWVRYMGPTPNCQSVFSSNGQVSNGIELMGYSDSGSCALLYIDGYGIGWPSSTYNLPIGSWAMLTAQFSDVYSNLTAGGSKLAYVYLNNTLIAYNSIPGSTPTTLGSASSIYYIGANSPAGDEAFNGLIANVQLYSRMLSAEQIAALYSRGVASLPVPGSGLEGWWPLLGDANDYSGGGSNGTLSGNALFTGSSYGSNADNGAYDVFTFNGMQTANIMYSGALGLSGRFSVSLWFESARPSTNSFTSELFDTLQTGGNTLNIRLAGSNSVGGFTGIEGSIGDGSSQLSGSVDYPFSFVQGSWHHLVESFSGSGWTIYIDGKYAASGSYTGTPELLGSGSYIGIGGGLGLPFYGQISNVQVYNAVLTATQVSQLYQQGAQPQSSVGLSLG